MTVHSVQMSSGSGDQSHLQVCAGRSILKRILPVGRLGQSQVQRVQAALVLQPILNKRLEHVSLIAERKS